MILGKWCDIMMMQWFLLRDFLEDHDLIGAFWYYKTHEYTCAKPFLEAVLQLSCLTRKEAEETSLKVSLHVLHESCDSNFMCLIKVGSVSGGGGLHFLCFLLVKKNCFNCFVLSEHTFGMYVYIHIYTHIWMNICIWKDEIPLAFFKCWFT